MVGQTMAASDKIYSIKLEENDVPGAKFRCSDIMEHSVVELKRWLECRGLSMSGTKSELVTRCLACMASKQTDIVVNVDGGVWYQQKVQEILSQNVPECDVPLLPTTGWNAFPSTSIPKGFCYGRIYEHIIQTAAVHQFGADSGSTDDLTDYKTSKPMSKGRQYFLSGHVKNINDQRNGDFYFLKSTVLASYTQQQMYHVSLTLTFPKGKVIDASCNCKASAMGRCNHIASLLFAIEDYTLQFGFEPIASTSKLCTWNVGRKSKRQPLPCHSTSYCKKLKVSRFRNYNPLGDLKIDKSKISNSFISTLPSTDSESMFDQILEIEYSDYTVDYDYLRCRTDAALKLLTLEDTGPFEVQGTVGQVNSDIWAMNRNCRITASIAKDVFNAKSRRGNYHLLNRILWGKKLPILASLQYGLENEDTAFSDYALFNDKFLIKKSGFWIDPKFPELGCSPDGLIFDKDQFVGVVEIKCPYVFLGKDPMNVEELKPSQRNNLFYTIQDGDLVIKESHKYFYQVQMQMGICNVKFCDFVVWSSKRTIVKRVHFDEQFWLDLRSKLISFHHNCLMPEYLEMRIPRQLLPVDLSERGTSL